MKYPLTSSDYRKALLEGKLLGLRCNQCDKYTFPPKMVCMECGSEDIQIAELSGNAEVKTFTINRVPPEGFKAPYIVAIVKLVEGPRAMCNVEGIDLEEASMELIGKKGVLGFKKVKRDKFSGGDMAALTFLPKE